jgi:hypothetical protein
MILQAISTEHLSAVVGAVRENVCRVIGGATGALLGAAAGSTGLPGLMAGFAGVSNIMSDRSVTGAALDVAAAGASTIPGPVGAAGGAYTYAKIGSNTGAFLCGYPWTTW